MKNLFKSLVYAIGFSLMVHIVMRYDLPGSIKEIIEYGWAYSFKGIMKTGFQLFIISLCIISIIFCGIKSIWHMILYNYNLFFYENEKKVIKVTVDENYTIRDSFVELFDGRIIPIDIKKIAINKPEEEKEEEKEEQ